ncbi:MAG TPA: VWA domain-containing protein [Verrucomicrobiae bacterium]|nr:VWA domain-containing protein [Verrucomicrobiae bacterium]
MRRLSSVIFACGLLAAQQPQQTPPPKPAEPGQPPVKITTTVIHVTAPVLVYDRDGSYVNGLQPFQFHLYDNGKEQNITVDVTYTPISVVICLQANAHVEGILPQVRKIGNLISPLLIGDQGEAALIAYDSRIRMLQDFTSDGDKITKVVKDLYAGSNANRMIDAVVEATRMLSHRPENRRRIILLIGETRDLSSENRLREALINLQLANIMFYSVDMSRLFSTLTAKPDPGRQNNLPPAMSPAVGLNMPATPTTVQQATGFGNAGRAEFIPLMVELFKDVKAIFKDNPVEAFTKGTGGTELSFYKQRGLEEAVQRIGAELHSQYFVSYSPNNSDEGGFHEITVAVASPEVKRVQTRPGYWLSNK